MSLFGGLYVGTSGLQASQNALNTTAHNMTNVDTEGYVRQQVQQATRSYRTITKTGSANAYQQTGLGVSLDEVKQVRDYFLDKSYRREHGREGFYNVSCDAIEEVENIFQELDGQAFADTLENLYISIQELSKDPSNTVNQGVFMQRCAEFVTRADTVYDNLCEYQDDLNLEVQKKVTRINEIGDRLLELNDSIRKIESGKVERANDLNDERNLLIDELSEYANISVNTDIDGNYIVQLEGVDFVNLGSVKHMALYPDNITGFYTPYWESLAERDPVTKEVTSIKGAEVFNMEREISTDMNTDIGSLKSVLLARGDRRTTFDDVSTQDKYDKVKDSVIMNVMAEFDNLVHEVTTRINKVMEDEANRYNGVGDGSYLRDENGDPYKIFNVSVAVNGDDRDYKCGNIIINDKLKQSPSLLGFITPDAKADHMNVGDELKAVFTNEDYQLNPEVRAKTSLNNYYNNLVSQVTNTGYVMRGISANQTITVTNIASAREQILGVSTDEELSNMIMFQNAFNASSRYINAMNELIEHIITTLGR